MCSTQCKTIIITVFDLKECLSLIQQAEHQLAIANSLSLKFHQGLEIKLRNEDGSSTAGSKEISTSVQILAEDKQELVLRDPTTSLTGIALQGLLVAQEATQQVIMTLLYMLQTLTLL